MVDRLRTSLSVEALEDRTLPSSAPPTANLFVGGPAALALQTNGDILEVGEAAASPPGGSGSTTTASNAAGLLALARFTPDGRLDLTFGTGGEAWTPIESSPGEMCALSVQSDGTIVLTVATPGAAMATVARFDNNGSVESVGVQPLLNAGWTISISDAGGCSCESALVAFAEFVGTIEVVYNQLPPVQSDTISGTATTQLPWTKPTDPGAPTGPNPVGRSPLFLSVTTAPLHENGFSPSVSSPSPVVLVQLPWTRANDSLLSANDSAPPAEYSAILLITLGSLEGGDVRLSGVDAGPAGLHRAAAPSATELPTYLHDAPLVTTVFVAAPPSDVPAPARPVLLATDEGLPAYLIGSEAPALTATTAAGDSATENTCPDAGLAAVDAAFGLLAQEKNLTDVVRGPLPADSRDAQRPQWRRIECPMWFVLLVAASGGGAVYACPGLRRTAGSNRGDSEVTLRGIRIGAGGIP